MDTMRIPKGFGQPGYSIVHERSRDRTDDLFHSMKKPASQVTDAKDLRGRHDRYNRHSRRDLTPN
jgi:hypothetical protein